MQGSGEIAWLPLHNGFALFSSGQKRLVLARRDLEHIDPDPLGHGVPPGLEQSESDSLSLSSFVADVKLSVLC